MRRSGMSAGKVGAGFPGIVKTQYSMEMTSLFGSAFKSPARMTGMEDSRAKFATIFASSIRDGLSRP